MPQAPSKSATQHYSAWPGTNEVTMTYNAQGRLIGASIFVTNGMTGQVFYCTGPGQPTVELMYVAPDPTHLDIVATLGGVVEVLAGVLGMRWTEALSPFDTTADGVSFGWGFSYTVPI